MTTHDRYKVIAAAKDAGIQVIIDAKFGRDDYQSAFSSFPSIERLYAIAFENGCQAEREEIALSLTPYDKPNKTEVQRMADVIAVELVEAIRARGESK